MRDVEAPDQGYHLHLLVQVVVGGLRLRLKGLHEVERRRRVGLVASSLALVRPCLVPSSPHPILLVLPVARVAGGGGAPRRAPEVLLVDAVAQRVGDAADDGPPDDQISSLVM